MTAQSARLVAERARHSPGYHEPIPAGCGDVITSPQAPQLIQGVEVEAIVQFPDDRGCFAELFRFGEPGLARDFDPAQRQPNPGFIYGFLSRSHQGDSLPLRANRPLGSAQRYVASYFVRSSGVFADLREA